ncbi:hypothetical protein TcWFU_008601 [Taenia crassiceps]|uniref:DBF4-type domain-containing protein n=1 Tax=Taenia crassiceps TaxID=6207 RepID=A0ABR4QMQ7_9CEST
MVINRFLQSISQFFDRKIDYVITNLPKDRWPSQATLSPGCSSKENVDPRSKNSPQISTGTHPSPSLQNSPLGVTRGRAMLLAVKKVSKPSTASLAIDHSVPGTRHPHDILLRAREFGIKVLTIDVVRKWVRALPEDVKMQLEVGGSPFFDSGTTSEADDPQRDRLWLLRPLVRPCIKIVDLKAQTRPSYMEKTNYMECLWRPFLDSSSTATSLKTSAFPNVPQIPTTPAGTSTTPQASVGLPPSTNIVTSQRTTELSRRDLGAKNSPGVSMIRSSYKGFSSSKRRKPSTKSSRGALVEPSGYCECCLSHFNNLYAHVTGTCHKNYAENAENFRQFDQLLSELPSMREVLAKARGVKVVGIAPPPNANAPAPPNGQIQETSPQPTHAAHEPIDGTVMDFSALPPLPTPSVPQYPEVGDSSASQLFSDNGECSNISIVDDLPSSLLVGEASPTLQPVSIHVPATYSSPFPPPSQLPFVTPAQDAEQTATTSLLRGVAGGALAQPTTTIDSPLESTCPPLHPPNEPPNLRATPLISQAPAFRGAAPAVTSLGSVIVPPRIGTCTVQEIISSIVIASPQKVPAAALSLPSPRGDTSPVLKKRFRKCTECQCMHVPTEVPIQLRLQCGGASSDRTRDTQARFLPPPCSQFLSPQRSRAQPNKRTRVSAQRANSKPSFPCGVCGSNVNYKMMALFGPLAMLDDFCPRLFPLTAIPATVISTEDGRCPATSNKKPKCASLLSSVVSPRNRIPSRSRSIDLETVDHEDECADLCARSNDQDFQSPMIEASSSDEKGNVDAVQLSPPLADEAENPLSIVVDQEHYFPRSPVLLAESMSPTVMHNGPTSVSTIIISSDTNKEAEDEKGSENIPNENQATTVESVDAGITPLEQPIAGVRGGNRHLQSTTLRSHTYPPVSRTMQRRTRRRNKKRIGTGSNEVFSFGSYGDLKLNFSTDPDLGTTQYVSEPSSIDSRATMVSALPSPLLCPVLSPEFTSLSGPRQQGNLPRRASLVARESINLSLQALYTPMKFGSDRAFCFDLDAENAPQVVMEEVGETAITPKRKVGRQKRSRSSSQMSDDTVSPGPWKKRQRRP